MASDAQLGYGRSPHWAVRSGGANTRAEPAAGGGAAAPTGADGGAAPYGFALGRSPEATVEPARTTETTAAGIRSRERMRPLRATLSPRGAQCNPRTQRSATRGAPAPSMRRR